MTPSRNVVAVTDEAVKAATIAILKLFNTDDSDLRHLSEDQLKFAIAKGLAEGALSAAYPSMVAEVERLRGLLSEGLGIVATSVSGFDTFSKSDLAWNKASIEWRERARAALTEAKT